jgi:hypothetical protein
MTTPPIDAPVDRLAAPPRQLADDVFPSAEESVLAQSASTQSFAQAAEPARPAHGFPYEDVVARHVAAKPFQSALMAVAAGALVAVVLQSALSRRRR